MEDPCSVAALNTIEILLYHRHRPSLWLSSEARSAIKRGLSNGHNIRILTRVRHNTCLVEILDDRPGEGEVSFYTESNEPIEQLDQYYRQAMGNWQPAVVVTSEF